MIKLEVFQKHPYLADFSLRVFKDKTSHEIRQINPDFPLDIYRKVYITNKVKFWTLKNGVQYPYCM